MRIIIPILIIAMTACQPHGKIGRKSQGNSSSTPHVLVYKTRADYAERVPVLLSDDRTRIIGYPDPKDVMVNGAYPVPTPLNAGYLLDNRGVGVNVAFLKMTYREYSALQRLPSLDELYGMILDKDPLTELLDLGSRTAFTDPVAEINRLIDTGKVRSTASVLK